jgi:hypothetical protein
MKKTFPLHAPEKTDERVVESIKIEVRKYVKRERRKLIPEGFDQWDFACKVGTDQATAEIKTVAEIYPTIDAVAKTASPQIYVEVIASAGKRTPSVVAAPPVDKTPAG